MQEWLDHGKEPVMCSSVCVRGRVKHADVNCDIPSPEHQFVPARLNSAGFARCVKRSLVERLSFGKEGHANRRPAVFNPELGPWKVGFKEAWQARLMAHSLDVPNFQSR